jgi:uncharacterized protein (DUF952 family)
MSAKPQLKETAEKWFKGQEGLVIVCVDLSKLSNLKWETSRANEQFPHVYGDVNPLAIVWTKDLPTTQDKQSFVFPDEVLPL